MAIYPSRAKKIQERIQSLGACSDDPSCVNRTFGTKAFKEGSDQIANWMREAGLQTHVDNIGNVIGLLVSSNPDAKTFVIGSHFDTVMNAGKFDGPLGIIMGIDLAENIIQKKMDLPFHLEIIAFSEEEGVRFHAAYLGSKVLVGNFEQSLFARKDEDGTSLGQVLKSLEYDSTKIMNDKIPAENWLGYLEIHIEQGPVLYEKKVPVGIVSAIAGQKRIEIKFSGRAGHAGTVPMNMRSDALCAAAHFIVGVEEYASHERRNMVATVGKINIPNSASNVIPGKVICTLDIRSADETRLAKAYEALNKMCEEICRRRDIYFEWTLVQESNPVQCNENLKELLSKSIKRKNIELVNMVSGAGHDAVVIAQVAPVAMMFVRCFKGISHHPL
ncbi:MAG: M20 family metallo-hydrolase, partial [Ginsengibacter sp.]